MQRKKMLILVLFFSLIALLAYFLQPSIIFDSGNIGFSTDHCSNLLDQIKTFSKDCSQQMNNCILDLNVCQSLVVVCDEQLATVEKCKGDLDCLGDTVRLCKSMGSECDSAKKTCDAAEKSCKEVDDLRREYDTNCLGWTES